VRLLALGKFLQHDVEIQKVLGKEMGKEAKTGFCRALQNVWN
jgi:hypothetical protein